MKYEVLSIKYKAALSCRMVILNTSYLIPHTSYLIFKSLI